MFPKRRTERVKGRMAMENTSIQPTKRKMRRPKKGLKDRRGLAGQDRGFAAHQKDQEKNQGGDAPAGPQAAGDNPAVAKTDQPGGSGSPPSTFPGKRGNRQHEGGENPE